MYFEMGGVLSTWVMFRTRMSRTSCAMCMNCYNDNELFVTVITDLIFANTVLVQLMVPVSPADSTA